MRDGRAYLAGSTSSPNYPTTAGAFDRTLNVIFESGFVTKLNASGSALAYSTFLDGTNFEGVVGIAVDGSGRAYVTGTTEEFPGDVGIFYPPTPGAFDTTLNSERGVEAFVTKLPTG